MFKHLKFWAGWEKSTKIVFLFLFIVLAGLLFFRLGRADLLSDDGHYAFRSLGYFDYMASQQQTTPVQWLGFRPFWSFLGFNDHPLMFFLIQHIFFAIGGWSVIVSRLPSVLASLGTFVFVFLLGRKASGKWGGYLAGVALLLNNYFIWTGRIGLIEGVLTFFFTAGLHFFTRGFENKKSFLWAALLLGLAALTKYFAFYLLPGILIYLLWRKRGIFKNKYFWWSLGLFVVLLLPIIITNVGMYHVRHHFDYQFASLFGQHTQDIGVSSRSLHFSPNPWPMLKVLLAGWSWPYFILAAASFIYSWWRAIKTKNETIILSLCAFTSLLIMMIFSGAADRWMGVTSSLIALLIGYSLVDLIKLRRIFRYVAAGLGVVLVAYLFVFIVNTNHVHAASGNKFLTSSLRSDNLGYNQLDRELGTMLKGLGPTENEKAAETSWFYHGIDPSSIDFKDLHDPTLQPFNSIIVFDVSTSWFADVWTFEKLKFYRRFLVMDSAQYYQMLQATNGKGLDPLGLDGFYFIKASPEVEKASGINAVSGEALEKAFQEQKVMPKIIKDDKGRDAFSIYYYSLR